MSDEGPSSPHSNGSAPVCKPKVYPQKHSAGRVLVVEDDPTTRLFFRTVLEKTGMTVFETGSVETALQTYIAEAPDVVILDHILPDGNALDLLPSLQDLDPDVLVAILTGHSSIDLAVRATKAGAASFLAKPVDSEYLLVVIDRLLRQSRNRRRQLAYRATSSKHRLNPFLGTSPAIRRLREEAERYLDTPSPVLIEGETGVGKGVLARWIHQNSPRANEPFLEINCAGLTSAFLDAELFGHSKGAFTGATAAKPGLFEVADHGTVFLDEIADVDLQIQPKLLKVLEEMRFRRLGEVKDRTTDVRLVAASNHSLAEAVESGQFRQDLYFRVSVLPLRIPPLRERPDDVRWIAQVLLTRIAANLGRPAVQLSPDAFETLRSYSWPGNIRELRNVLERAVLLSDRDLLDSKILKIDDTTRGANITKDLSLSLEEVEEIYTKAVLDELGGNVAEAATRLGIPRSTLYKKLKRYQNGPSEG